MVRTTASAISYWTVLLFQVSLSVFPPPHTVHRHGNSMKVFAI